METQNKSKDNYLDLTNNEYKKNNLVGLEITKRPYKKWALGIAGLLGLVSLIVPDFGIMFLAGFKFLMRFG